MQDLIVQYLCAAAIFGVLDFAWLTVTGDRVYRLHLGTLMREKIALPAAIGFYLAYVAALTGLAVAPAVSAEDPMVALRNGLLLGFGAYGTYNLTNAATLRGWSRTVTFTDWTWGTLVSGASAWLAVLALRAI